MFASSKALYQSPKFLNLAKEMLSCMQETTVQGNGGRGPPLNATEQAVHTLCGLNSHVKRCLIRLLHKIGTEKTLLDVNKAQGCELNEYLEAKLPNVLLDSSKMLKLCELIRTYVTLPRLGAAGRAGLLAWREQPSGS